MKLRFTAFQAPLRNMEEPQLKVYGEKRGYWKDFYRNSMRQEFKRVGSEASCITLKEPSDTTNQSSLDNRCKYKLPSR